MLRTEWDTLTDNERRRWATENGQGRCIEQHASGRCHEPAGTPWGKYWCAHHDDRRLARISAGLRSIQRDMHSEPNAEEAGQ